MPNTDHLFIDGSWTPSQGNEVIEVVNPATEEVVATVPAGTAADVDAAVDAAARAFPGWAALSPDERASYVGAICDHIESRAEEIAAIITTELGCPTPISVAMQVGLPLAEARAQIEFAKEVQWERTVGNSLIVKEPIGVVGAIVPWNFPLLQVLRKLAPALIAGCTLVVKPAEETPLNAYGIAEAAMAAGLPAGVLNIVTGRGPVVGEALAAHPKVRMVSFTGSTTTGRRVSELALKDFKRVGLELGGKSAMVALKDADISAAVAATLTWTFINTGQACSGLTRILVPREKLPEAEAKAAEIAAGVVLGDPGAEGTTMGPVVSAKQLATVRGYIDKGEAEGAKLVVDGRETSTSKGYYVGPTIFSEVRPGMTIEQEEIFGPVLAIIGYDTEDEAIEIANGTRYGLAAAVFSPDDKRAREVASQLQAGQVEVNGGAFNPMAPFGGYKQSGNSRENGPFAIDEYLEVKSIQF